MIINWIEQYDELISRMNRELHVCTPIFRDMYLHPTVNKLLCVGITFASGDTYIVSITHRDAPRFTLPPSTTFTLSTNTKVLPGKDISTILYIQNKEIETLVHDSTSQVHAVYTYFNGVPDIHRIVPLTVWGSIIKRYHQRIIPNINDFVENKTYQFINDAVQTLHKIEQAGLKINEDVFNTHFQNKLKRYAVDGFVFSEYNPFTTTGRPSNRYGGINFAALNKNDHSRTAFISRFENGVLLQLDFESYHLRLIGKYMNVELPTEPIHHFLAKQYFNKEYISQEEYDRGKQITFSILYGADVDTDIPLLKSIKQLSNKIYTEYQKNGYILAPISHRKIFVNDSDGVEHKLFNYFVQCLEFEATVPQLKALLSYLKNKKSKFILYTYDAVLLDVHPTELNDVIRASKDLLSFNAVGQDVNAFPLRVYTGQNYDTLKLL